MWAGTIQEAAYNLFLESLLQNRPKTEKKTLEFMVSAKTIPRFVWEKPDAIALLAVALRRLI